MLLRCCFNKFKLLVLLIIFLVCCLDKFNLLVVFLLFLRCYFTKFKLLVMFFVFLKCYFNKFKLLVILFVLLKCCFDKFKLLVVLFMLLKSMLVFFTSFLGFWSVFTLVLILMILLFNPCLLLSLSLNPSCASKINNHVCSQTYLKVMVKSITNLLDNCWNPSCTKSIILCFSTILIIALSTKIFKSFFFFGSFILSLLFFLFLKFIF